MGYSKESERQNQVLGDLLSGKTPEKRVMVGYKGKEQESGDQISRMTDIMKGARMPMFCPNCDKIVKKRLDDKMWSLFGHCFVYLYKSKMISKYIEATILAFVQGFSEFIPVSSSAHLIIISKLSNFSISSLQLDISLHLGSLLAIVFYFRRDLLDLLNNKSLLLLIILGSLPLVIFGFIIYSTGLVDHLRNLKVIAWTTLLFGILLFLADKIGVKNNIENNLNIKNILIIGIFQILAVIPGVSRSGIIITISRFLKFDRVDSSKISFYLSIPALAGASVLSMKDVVNSNIDLNFIFIYSIIFSFLISYFTIKYFLIYVKKFNLNIFVYYRTFLALILFVIAYI